MNARVLAYLQLFRLPNVFTAVADILMGFLFVQLTPTPVSKLLLLIGSSCLLYTAGMVLNDVFDFDVDQRERPDRPLPSGRIDRGWAGKLGFGMLAAGVGVACAVSMQSAVTATLLAIAIYLYDGLLKSTPVAPLAMGSCRLLNVLLGMSLAAKLGPEHFCIAGGLGLYIAGVTWFARCEAATSHRGLLAWGVSIMLVGIFVMAALPWFATRPLLLQRPQFLWPALLGLLTLSVFRRAVFALWDPQPRHVQQAVKLAIFTLVSLDAAVVLAVAGPIWALVVLSLLVPSMLLGKWIYST